MKKTPNQLEIIQDGTVTLEADDWNSADVIVLVFPSDGLPNNNETNYMRGNYALLRQGYICVFDQVRDGGNPEQISITQSIGQTGLLNWVDVVRLTRAQIEDYSYFVCDLWGGKNIDIDALPNSTFETEMYDVLIAGHSRNIGIFSNEEKKAIAEWEAGRSDYNPKYARVPVKLHNVVSNGDIIKIQIAENLHKAPSEERVAIALVESYYLGLRDNLWTSPEEFHDQYKDKFTTKQLKDAVAFAKLPIKMRELVFSKVIPYSIGIILGNYSEVLYEYFEYKYFDRKKRSSLSEVEKQNLDALVESELEVEGTRIVKNRMSITVARKYFKGLNKAKQELMNKELRAETLGDIFDQTAKTDFAAIIRRKRYEVDQLLGDITQKEESKFISVHRIIGENKNNGQSLNQFLEVTEKIVAQTRRTLVDQGSLLEL